jgi:hypothetical protein
MWKKKLTEIKKSITTLIASPIIISVIISGVMQFYISKWQTDQQYNEHILEQRQNLIEKTVHLIARSAEYNFTIQHIYKNRSKVNKILAANYGVTLSGDMDTDSELLTQVIKTHKGLRLNPVDQIEVDRDSAEVAKLNQLISEHPLATFEDFTIVKNLADVYFGAKTQATFVAATNLFANENPESATSFNGGGALVPCLEAMKFELKDNLK